MKKLKSLIEKYFYMIDGENIEDYLKEIIFSHMDIEIKITYRTIKHIVEQRKKDNYSVDKVINIFIILQNSLDTDNYRILPHNNRYIFTEKIYTDRKGVCIILEIISIDKKSYYIRTAFFRLISKIKNLIQKIT